MFVVVVGMAGVNVGSMAGAAHLHQHEGSHGHHHECGKAEQEGAVDGEDRGCKHHQEGEDRKRDVIAFTTQREHAYDYAKQCQMNRCRQETAGKKKIVGCEEDEIKDGEWSGPVVGNSELTPLGQKVATDGEGGAHENDGWEIEGAGRGQCCKARQDKKIQGQFEVMVDGLRERDDAVLFGRQHSRELYGRMAAFSPLFDKCD